MADRTASAGAGFLVEDFITSITTQLDRVQDALRLKAVNRPLTYALKELHLELKVFVDMDAQGHVMLRAAGPNEAGASTLAMDFTTITKPMIEENTISLAATPLDAAGQPGPQARGAAAAGAPGRHQPGATRSPQRQHRREHGGAHGRDCRWTAPAGVAVGASAAGPRRQPPARRASPPPPVLAAPPPVVSAPPPVCHASARVQPSDDIPTRGLPSPEAALATRDSRSRMPTGPEPQAMLRAHAAVPAGVLEVPRPPARVDSRCRAATCSTRTIRPPCASTARR